MALASDVSLSEIVDQVARLLRAARSPGTPPPWLPEFLPVEALPAVGEEDRRRAAEDYRFVREALGRSADGDWRPAAGLPKAGASPNGHP